MRQRAGLTTHRLEQAFPGGGQQLCNGHRHVYNALGSLMVSYTSSTISLILCTPAAQPRSGLRVSARLLATVLRTRPWSCCVTGRCHHGCTNRGLAAGLHVSVHSKPCAIDGACVSALGTLNVCSQVMELHMMTSESRQVIF